MHMKAGATPSQTWSQQRTATSIIPNSREIRVRDIRNMQIINETVPARNMSIGWNALKQHAPGSICQTLWNSLDTRQLETGETPFLAKNWELPNIVRTDGLNHQNLLLVVPPGQLTVRNLATHLLAEKGGIQRRIDDGK